MTALLQTALNVALGLVWGLPFVLLFITVVRNHRLEVENQRLREYPPCPWCEVDGETPHREECPGYKLARKAKAFPLDAQQIVFNPWSNTTTTPTNMTTTTRYDPTCLQPNDFWKGNT